MRERTIEEDLVWRAREAGGMAVKLSRRGMPDRLVLLPGGRAVFVELKAPGQKPDPHQVRMIRRLQDLGFHVEVFRSLEEVAGWATTLPYVADL